MDVSLDHSEGSLLSEDALDTEDDALDTGDELDVSVDELETPDEAESVEFNRNGVIRDRSQAQQNTLVASFSKHHRSIDKFHFVCLESGDAEEPYLGAGATSSEAGTGRGAAEGGRDSRLWRSVVIGEQEHRIDMKCIEAYKRVISHGG